MENRHINYLIKMLRAERSMVRAFCKKLPEGKTLSLTTEYKLQLEIIKLLQALKNKKE